MPAPEPSKSMTGEKPPRKAQCSIRFQFGGNSKSVELVLTEIEEGAWYADVSGIFVPRLLGSTTMEVNIPRPEERTL